MSTANSQQSICVKHRFFFLKHYFEVYTILHKYLTKTNKIPKFLVTLLELTKL